MILDSSIHSLIEEGNLSALRQLKKELQSHNYLPCIHQFVYRAARCDQLAILEWLHSIYLTRHDDQHLLDAYYRSIIGEAIRYKSLRVLEWGLKHWNLQGHADFYKDTLDHYQDEDMKKFLVSKGLPDFTFSVQEPHQEPIQTSSSDSSPRLSPRLSPEPFQDIEEHGFTNTTDEQQTTTTTAPSLLISPYIENECPICLVSFEQNETIKKLPCLHYYHSSCYDQLLIKIPNAPCPMCRHVVNRDLLS